MKAREHDPGRLDVERFAEERGQLAGEWPLSSMSRLVEGCHSEWAPAATDRVAWQASGERRRAADGAQTWLHLIVDARVELTCQRCLGPIEIPLAIDRWFRFVAGEQQAAALDADSEEDVLASTRALDLQALAEDELLLALPLVPRHPSCPQPLVVPVSDGQAASEAEHPFAALAGLKRPRH